MTPTQIFIAILIHLIIPLLGIALYVLIFRRAQRAGASMIFQAELFFLFFIYGGLLTVIITALLWEWSGMASLGALFLLFCAPIVLIPVTVHLYRTRTTSMFHMRSFQAALAYFPLIVLSFGAAYRLP